MNLSYNINEIQTLLIDFYRITKLRIALFDHNFHELAAYPTRLSSFCKMIRSFDDLNEACRKCDFSSFTKAKITKNQIIYQCHLGLSEIIVPIQSSGIIIGYLMAGQIYVDTQSHDMWHKTLDYLKNYDLNFEELEVAYNNRPIISESILNSISKMITIYTYYLINTERVSLKKDTLAYQINKYILNHLSDDLSVEQLCNHFNYRKTTFYKITNEIYGTSIMNHIRQLRMQYARELLSSTDLKVSEIASKVGINDYNYFTKVFKKDARSTPSEYRKNNFSLYQ